MSSVIRRVDGLFWVPAVVGYLFFAAAGWGATLVEKTVQVQLKPGGEVDEHIRLRVRLETSGDLEKWALYAIPLNSNRVLERFDAAVVSPEGKRRKVGRKQQDRMEVSGDGIFHASDFFHVIEFEGLDTGSILDIDYVVSSRPYHPTDFIYLLEEDPIEILSVSVRGGGAGWRFRLDGPAEGLEVEALAGGVRVTGRNLGEIDPGPLTAGGAARQPVLRFGWQEAASWEDVAAWYRDLLQGLPRSTQVVRELSAELTSGAETDRGKLEALLAFLRKKVRYTAVEVGIGGYVPSNPAEVLDRRWGDCKDKSLLLVDLLGEAGIEAYPALILLDQRRRIDVEFPSPREFNHLIVAVPETEVEVMAGDPVADGFFFLDPTQTSGSAQWLNPGVQDQDALVVLAEGGRLVRTPTLAQHETASLVVDLKVAADGSARGRAGLLVKGIRATGFLKQIENAPPERSREDVLAVFGGLFPGSRVSDIGWREEGADVPAARMSLALEIDHLVGGLDSAVASRPSFQLASLELAPEARLLEQSTDEPVVLSAGEVSSLWRLELPSAWCHPKPDEKVTENAVGSFRQSIRQDEEGRTVIERTTRISRRWLEPADHSALRELALAEKRAAKRRIRMSCPEAG